VLYQPNWAAFAASGSVLDIAPDEEVTDTLDVADLVSESAHRYELSQPRTGHVTMRVLPNPKRPDADLWDAARIVPPGVTESFVLRGLDAGADTRLVMRVASAQSLDLELTVFDRTLPVMSIDGHDGWQHVSISLPVDSVQPEIVVGVRASQGRDSFHLWAVQRR
jgi:hypothetical protein